MLDWRPAALGWFRLTWYWAIYACKVLGLHRCLVSFSYLIYWPSVRCLTLWVSTHPLPVSWSVWIWHANLHETFDSTSYDENHEGKPRLPRFVRTYSEGSPAILFRADGTIPEQPELFRAVLQPDYMSDWHVHAISTMHLSLRLQHIYVSNDDAKDDAGSYTYVLLNNVLCAFITAADLRTQVAAFLYRVSPPDNKQVKEIKAVAWPPQCGSNNSIELPSQLPKDDFYWRTWDHLGGSRLRCLSSTTSHQPMLRHMPSWWLSTLDGVCRLYASLPCSHQVSSCPTYCSQWCWILHCCSELLGWRTSAGCILDHEFSHFLASLFISDDVCLLQFAKIEQGDDSTDVENSFTWFIITHFATVFGPKNMVSCLISWCLCLFLMMYVFHSLQR